MIPCPVCEGTSRVLDSRPNENGIRRRRKCEACGHRWTTNETNVLRFEARLDRLWREFLERRQDCLVEPTPETGIAAGRAFGAFVQAVADSADADQLAFLRRVRTDNSLVIEHAAETIMNGAGQ